MVERGEQQTTKADYGSWGRVSSHLLRCTAQLVTHCGQGENKENVTFLECGNGGPFPPPPSPQQKDHSPLHISTIPPSSCRHVQARLMNRYKPSGLQARTVACTSNLQLQNDHFVCKGNVYLVPPSLSDTQKLGLQFKMINSHLAKRECTERDSNPTRAAALPRHPAASLQGGHTPHPMTSSCGHCALWQTCCLASSFQQPGRLRKNCMCVAIHEESLRMG